VEKYNTNHFRKPDSHSPGKISDEFQKMKNILKKSGSKK